MDEDLKLDRFDENQKWAMNQIEWLMKRVYVEELTITARLLTKGLNRAIRLTRILH